MRRLGWRVQDVGDLVHPVPLLPVSGNTSRSAAQNPTPRPRPRAPGHVCRGGHIHAADPPTTPVDSRYPSARATRSLVIVGADADDDQEAQLVLLQPDAHVDAIDPHVCVVHTGQVALAERVVIIGPLLAQPRDRRRGQAGGRAEKASPRPARSPRRTGRAGTTAATSATFGDLRHHGGRITDRNRLRSPVCASTHLSLTRGAARTSTAPAAVITSRGGADPHQQRGGTQAAGCRQLLPDCQPPGPERVPTRHLCAEGANGCRAGRTSCPAHQGIEACESASDSVTVRRATRPARRRTPAKRPGRDG